MIHQKRTALNFFFMKDPIVVQPITVMIDRRHGFLLYYHHGVTEYSTQRARTLDWNYSTVSYCDEL